MKGESSEAGLIPKKFECRSLVCRIVNVFLPSAAGTASAAKTTVAAPTAEPTTNSRREMDPSVMRALPWMRKECGDKKLLVPGVNLVHVIGTHKPAAATLGRLIHAKECTTRASPHLQAQSNMVT